MRIPEVSEPTDLALIARLMLMTYLLIFVIPLSASEHNQPRENAYYEVREIEPDLVEIKVPHTGDVTYKNTSEQIDESPLREVPEMVIDVDVIDFDFYADRYVHWQNIHVWDPWDILVADTDQDGKMEVMGELWYPNEVPPDEPVFHYAVYEVQDDNTLERAYDYHESTTFPGWAGDIDGDGVQELLLRYHFINDDFDHVNSLQLYEAESSTQFATNLLTEHILVPLAQPNHVSIIDMDQDGQAELIYYMDGGEYYGDPCAGSIVILEYDESDSSFHHIDCFDPSSWYTSHFAFGDWDMDGHMEFATGGIDGEVYIVEATGPDTYELVFEDTLDTYNAYLSTSTNDMNGNGKPELWIGGDRSSTGTTIYCFESTGDNEYEIVFQIRIPGFMSFYQYGVVNTDINLDGIDELLIWLEGHCFIIQNVGPEIYEVIFAHQIDNPSLRGYMSTASKDVNGDGYPELLISMLDLSYENDTWQTAIYKPAGALLGTQTSNLPNYPRLLNAYPNPFNNGVTFNWPYTGQDEVSIQIFDIRGRVVYSNHFTSNPKHKKGEFQWNATNNLGEEVTSGVFIIKVANKESQFITKVVLIE